METKAADEGRIDEAIAELQSAVAGIERGDGPGALVEGHGLQSRRFRFEWRDESLDIRILIPCARLISSEEDQKDDDDEVVAACRMAILLLAARKAGSLLHADEGEALLTAKCDEFGTRYAIRDAEGGIVDSGDGWSTLAARLESAFAADSAPSGDVTIFWP